MTYTGTRLAAIIIACAAGCGGGVAIEDLDDELLDALCARSVRCGAAESIEGCRGQFESFSTALLELQHAVENGSVLYDEDAMRKCLDAVASMSCDRTSRDQRVEPPACSKAFRGTVPDGGVCLISAQCISGRCDISICPEACCEGTCEPEIPEAQIGASCAAADCVAGAFCDEAEICQPLLATGEACLDDDECDYNLHCSGVTDTCVDAPNRGEPCPDGSCADVGTFCDASSRCVGRPGRDEACGQFGSCQQPNICDQATLRCVPPPGPGQACQSTCAAGAYCDTQAGTCMEQKPEGAACTLDRECANGFCDDATSQCRLLPVCI